MASINPRAVATPVFTHEGGPASLHLSKVAQLRRVVLACMLWEDQFYVDGKSHAEIIAECAKACTPIELADTAREARGAHHLRHVPLLLVRELARHAGIAKFPGLVKDTLEFVIQRPDELTEFMALYMKDKRQPVAAAVKKGLAAAFTKFNEYSLAKYNNQDKAWKLRDVLFMCHAKPNSQEQEALWKRLVENALATPDTWEVSLSAGTESKQAAWTRLLKDGKLGALALLRNLRNMEQANVSEDLIRTSLAHAKTDKVLPFRFIAASRYAPRFEPELESLMLSCVAAREKLPGKTVLLVDVSGSMNAPLSARSEMTRTDAAYGLAILLREICEKVDVFSFSNNTVLIPARRGFALRDAIHRSQSHSGTYLGRALREIPAYDRLIVLTDEQSADRIPDPTGFAYIINVAAYRNGIGYDKYIKIDGWSEAVVDFIQAIEPK